MTLSNHPVKKPNIRRALDYLLPYRWSLAAVLAISLTGTAMTLYLPLLSRGLVDQALLGQDMSALIRIVSLFVAIPLASFVLNVISGMIYTKLSADVLFDMRVDVYRHLQRLSPRFFASRPLGDMVEQGRLAKLSPAVHQARSFRVPYLLDLVIATIEDLDRYVAGGRRADRARRTVNWRRKARVGNDPLPARGTGTSSRRSRRRSFVARADDCESGLCDTFTARKPRSSNIVCTYRLCLGFAVICLRLAHADISALTSSSRSGPSREKVSGPRSVIVLAAFRASASLTLLSRL